jgi:hypothetical protein
LNLPAAILLKKIIEGTEERFPCRAEIYEDNVVPKQLLVYNIRSESYISRPLANKIKSARS